MKYPIIAVTVLISMLILAHAGLCDADREGVPLTLEHCRERAIMYSDNLRIEETRREQAHLRVREQRTHYLPKLSASGHYLAGRNRFEWDVDRALFAPLGAAVPLDAINPLTGRPIDDLSGHHITKQTVWYTTVRAEQPIYMGGKIGAANRMAVTAEKISRRAVETERQAVIVEAEHTYWRFVSVSEQIQAAIASVELLESLEEQVSHAVETGLVHRNELLTVRVRRNEALLNLERAKNGRELVRMSLCRLMGYDLDRELEIADVELAAPVRDDMPGRPDLSVAMRPEYRMLEKRVGLQRENEQLVRSEYLPRVGLMVGYGYQDGMAIYRTDLSSHGYYLLASAQVPLWQWGESRYRTQSARLDSRIAELDLQKFRKQMELEIQQAYFALSEAFARCAMTETALEEAQAAMEMSRDRYDVGMEPLTGYLEAQTQWQQAQAEHICAKAEFWIRRASYVKATGTRLDEQERKH